MAGTYTFTVGVRDSSALPMSTAQSYTLRVLNIVNGMCTVAPSGALFTSIQAAVNYVNCQTVSIAAGTYRESVTIGRSLVITGAGASTTVLDGQLNAADPASRARVFAIAGGTVSISGLTVRNGKAAFELDLHTEPGGGLLIRQSARVTLTDMVISNNGAQAGAGLAQTASRAAAHRTIASAPVRLPMD